MSPSIEVSIRELGKDAPEMNIKAAIRALAEAFEDDRFNHLICGGHKDLIQVEVGSVLRAALIGGSVYVAEAEAEGVIGTAVWFGPGQELLGSDSQAEAGFNQFMEDLTKRDQAMLAWWMEYFLPEYAKYATAFFGEGYKLSGWHLQLIGVVPRMQRRKVGTNLIRHVEREVEESGDPDTKHLCLEAEVDTSVEFYKAIGFVDRGKMILEGEKKLGESVPMWYMSKNIA